MALPANDIFQLLNGEFFSALFGAIAGSGVGGFIAWRIQKHGLRAEREAHAEAERVRQRSIAASIMVKLESLYVALGSLTCHAGECSREAAERRNGLYIALQPLTTFPQADRLTTEEWGLLIDRAPDLYSRMRMLELGAQNDLATFRTIIEQRAAFIADFLVELRTGGVPQERREEFEGRERILTRLVGEWVDDINAEERDARALIVDLGHQFEGTFTGFPQFRLIHQDPREAAVVG